MLPSSSMTPIVIAATMAIVIAYSKIDLLRRNDRRLIQPLHRHTFDFVLEHRSSIRDRSANCTNRREIGVKYSRYSYYSWILYRRSMSTGRVVADAAVALGTIDLTGASLVGDRAHEVAVAAQAVLEQD